MEESSPIQDQSAGRASSVTHMAPATTAQAQGQKAAATWQTWRGSPLNAQVSREDCGKRGTSHSSGRKEVLGTPRAVLQALHKAGEESHLPEAQVASEPRSDCAMPPDMNNFPVQGTCGQCDPKETGPHFSTVWISSFSFYSCSVTVVHTSPPPCSPLAPPPPPQSDV